MNLVCTHLYATSTLYVNVQTQLKLTVYQVYTYRWMMVQGMMRICTLSNADKISVQKASFAYLHNMHQCAPVYTIMINFL